MTNTNNAALLVELRARAVADTAKWPVYAGHFDKLVLGRALRRVETKMGVAFEPGEMILVYPFGKEPFPAARSRMAWSFRNNIATSVGDGAIEEILV